MEEGAKDTNDSTSEMRRGDFGNVLRTGAKSSCETENESTKDENTGVGSSSLWLSVHDVLFMLDWVVESYLDNSSDDGEGTASKVDSSSSKLIRQGEERSTTEASNCHQSIDNTESRALVIESVVIVPSGVGVYRAKHTPIYTITDTNVSERCVTA